MADQKPKKISSLKGVHHKLGMANNTHRTVYVAFGIFMVVLALIILTVTSVGRSTGVATCKNIILGPEKNQCYLSYATSTQNISDCSGISTKQESYQCMATVAEGKRSVEDCSYLSASHAQYVGCVVNITYSTKNVSSCGLLDPSNDSACAYSLASSENFSSISYCSGIPLGSVQLLCDSNYYYSRAYVTGNDSYCGHLINTTNATISESLIASNANASSGLSTYYAGGVSPRDLCYIVVGHSTQRGSVCQDITNSTDQGICGYYLNSTANTTLSSTQPSQLCASNQSAGGQLCQYTVYTNLATTKDNLTECGLISNITYQDYCIVDFATKYANASACKSITNQTLLSGCEYQAGLSGGNYTT